MKGFKFKRIKNKFRWESNFMVLEFSNPSIQGFDDYTNLTSEKGIMYYYYTVKVFKKVVVDWDDNDNEITKWKLVGSRSTHDFPCILDLKWILDYQLNDDTKIDGQKHEYQSGEIRYSKVMVNEGFACDDYYEIRKCVNSNGKDDRYIVYCGTIFECQGDLNSVGIRTPYVNRKDIEELLQCVSSFIQYSLDDHNKENESWKNRFEIKYNKIYEYYADNQIVDKNKIESMYVIGDILDITTVVNNKQYEHYKTKISKIENNNLILESGEVIALDSVVYIMDEVDKKKLKYKENEIAQDFMSILSSEEREEFKNYSLESLLNKYKEVIIDRTWMCRDEHEFNIDYHSGDMVNAVTPIVKKVVNIIKENLDN
jgi:hypothetical protein